MRRTKGRLVVAALSAPSRCTIGGAAMLAEERSGLPRASGAT